LRPGGCCVPSAAVPDVEVLDADAVPGVDAVPDADAVPDVDAPVCGPPGVWVPFAVAFVPAPAGVAGLISESVSTPPGPT